MRMAIAKSVRTSVATPIAIPAIEPGERRGGFVESAVEWFAGAGCLESVAFEV